MRGLLIRYLLGELDEVEHEEVQRRLVESPELRRELAQLRACFATSCQDREPAEPPRDLASRTTQRVAGGDEPTWRGPSRAESDPPAGVLGWSLADLTVAGGVVMAVSMLLFPALGDSRNETRRTVCQHNLQQMWQLATRYADDRGDYYPRVAPRENAGMFAVRLVDKGYIAPQDMALILVCPAAPFADVLRSGDFVMHIPTCVELASMPPRELAGARRHMSPFYDYRLPYRVGDEYVDIKAERTRFAPLFADRSAAAGQELISPNHGGSIIQVVFQDGSVRSLTTRMLSHRNDDMSFNSLGQVAAGWGPRDIVLGRSESPPAFDHTPRR